MLLNGLKARFGIVDLQIVAFQIQRFTHQLLQIVHARFQGAERAWYGG